MLTFSVLKAPKVKKRKETRDCDYTGTFLCELLIQPQNTVRMDLKYKECIVSLSVNTSCNGKKWKKKKSILPSMSI